jgi:hypothetical protein
MTSLVEEARLDAKAFRENTVYDSEGDPIRLIANADRLDQYAAALEALCEALEKDAARFAYIKDAINSGKFLNGTDRLSFSNTVWHMECEARAALERVS